MARRVTSTVSSDWAKSGSDNADIPASMAAKNAVHFIPTPALNRLHVCPTQDELVWSFTSGSASRILVPTGRDMLQGGCHETVLRAGGAACVVGAGRAGGGTGEARTPLCD